MKVKCTYKPEAGSQRTWVFDMENPAWDLAYVTETETGWPWQEFLDKLAHGSHIALRALVFTLRKRDEPRLSIDGVTVTFDEVDIDEEPEPKGKKAAKSDPEA